MNTDTEYIADIADKLESKKPVFEEEKWNERSP